MSTIETLLHRLDEGVITDEERAELDRLTHRDQVWQAATHRADTIRRHRRAGIVAVCAVVAVTGAVLLRNPSSHIATSQAPLVAQQTAVPTSSTAAVSTDNTAQMESEARPVSMQRAVVARRHAAVTRTQAVTPAQTSTPQVQEVYTTAPVEEKEMPADIHTEGDQIIACNSQCSADSVIRDIWKFLRA